MVVAALLVAGVAPGCDAARADVEVVAAPRDESARDALRRPDALVAAMAIAPGARVADVGAGDGYLTVHLAGAAGPAGRVVATDIDAAALAQLAARLAGRSAVARAAAAPVEIRRVTAAAPGLEPASYDRIVLAEVDQYVADRASFFRQLATALAPGGRLAVSNRMPYRAADLAAAAAAGLRVREPDTTASLELDLPAQFLLILEPSP